MFQQHLRTSAGERHELNVNRLGMSGWHLSGREPTGTAECQLLAFTDFVDLFTDTKEQEEKTEGGPLKHHLKSTNCFLAKFVYY